MLLGRGDTQAHIFIHVCIYIYLYVRIYFVALSVAGPRNNDTLGSAATSGTPMLKDVSKGRRGQFDGGLSGQIQDNWNVKLRNKNQL